MSNSNKCLPFSIKVGEKFDKLTVYKYLGGYGTKKECLCKCDCGNDVIIKYRNLKRNVFLSCQKCIKEFKLNLIKSTNIGTKIDKLLIIDIIKSPSGCNYDIFICKCDCGNTKEINRKYLKKIGYNNKKIDCGIFPCRGFRRIKNARVGEISGHYWCVILQNAKKRNIPINITQEYIWDLFLKQDRKCAITGLKLLFSNKQSTTASLDRIDNSKGYIEGNIQWVHKRINKMKHAFNEDDFIQWCHLVANNTKERFNPLRELNERYNK